MTSATEAQEFASYWRQLYSCMSMYALAATIGTVSGLSGIALPQIEKDLNFSKAESAWFASISQLGMISTCAIGGVLGQKFGRRKSALFVTPIHLIGFTIQLLSSSSFVLQLGRFINGVAGGLTSGVAPVYISEICTNKYRTSFGSGLSAFYLFGTNFVFIMGSILEWRSLIGTCIIFPVLGIVTMMTIPDSPVWLITKGRDEEAKKGLLWLRGRHYTYADEELSSIKSHYDEIVEKSRAKLEGKSCTKVLKFFQTLSRPDVYKPLIIVTTLMVLQQFCGMSAITYYAIQILMNSKTSLNHYAATVIFGIVRFFSQLVGTFLLSRFTRRKLFFTSAFFMGIGTAIIGLGTYIKDNNNASVLPIIGVCISAAAYPIGLSPIPWSYTSELFPPDIRAEMCGITNAFVNSYIFCVVLSFPFINEALGGAVVFWMFSSVCVLAIIFSIFFLPETKDLKLEDISKSFEKSSRKKNEEENTKDPEEEVSFRLKEVK